MTAEEYVRKSVEGKSVYCYGAGNYGKTVAYALFLFDCDFRGFIVSNTKDFSDEVLHKKVFDLKYIPESDEVLILVCASLPARENIIENLKRFGMNNYLVISDEIVTELERTIPFDVEVNNEKMVNVLLYHRVCEIKNDVWKLAIAPKEFEKQMKFLADNYKFIRFEDDYSKAKEKSFVITFDDGYYDNYKYALPILEKYNIPATIFITTDNINTTSQYWWDELECYIPHFLSDAEENRRAKLNSARSKIMKLNKAERKKFFDEMRAERTSKEPLQRLNRTLNKDEIVELFNNPLITIGAHTKSHCKLSELTIEEQRDEIMGSKEILQKIVGDNIEVFSYPFGNEGDYDENTMEIVKACGYKRAASVRGGLYKIGDNEFEVPRNNIPGGTDLEQFKKIIRKHWFEY